MDESTNNASQSDSKMGLIIGALILVVIAGGGYYYWSTQMSKAKTSTQPAAMEQDADTDGDEKMETTVSGTAAPATTESAKVMMEAGAQTVTVEGGNFYFKPNEIRVKAGTPVKVTFKNSQGFHDFVIDDLDVKSKQITAGNSEVLEFTPKKKGTYEFYCSVGQHRQMGMKGNLIVE